MTADNKRLFELPTDDSCVTPGSCLGGGRCQAALAVFINPSSTPTCTHREVQIALEEREKPSRNNDDS